MCRLTLLAEVYASTELIDGSGGVWTVAWHPNKSCLASCSGRHVKLWCPVEATTQENAPTDSSQWQCVASFGEEVHTRSIRSLAFTSDGLRLACASFDSSASVWKAVGTDLTYKNVTKLEDTHDSEVKSVAWSPDSKLLATCSRDKTMWIHERTVRGGKLYGAAAKHASTTAADEGAQSEEYFCASVNSGHSEDIKSVRWHPSLNMILTASYDDTIRVWLREKNGSDWRCAQVLNGHTGTVWSVSFDSLGQRFVSASDDKTVRIWSCSVRQFDVTSPSDQITQSWYVNPIFRTALDSGRVRGPAKESSAIATDDDASTSTSNMPSMKLVPRLDVYVENDMREARQLWSEESTLQGVHDFSIFCVDWCPGRNLVATASGDNSIAVYSEAPVQSDGGPNSQWSLVCHLKNAHKSDVNCVQWKVLKDPQTGEERVMLASCGDDGFVRIWKFNDDDL